jgi:hypothetical protein
MGAGDGQFDIPAAVATDAAGSVYVTEFFNNARVQKFVGSLTPTHATSWGRLKIRYR